MDLRIFETGSKEFDFPTVITFEDLTVNFFNEKFRGLVPDVAAGSPLGKYMIIPDIAGLIRENSPAPCVAEIGGVSCMCAFCPVYSGFNVNYSFSAAAPGDDGSSCRYLIMKIAILQKCAGAEGVRSRGAKPDRRAGELLDRVNGCLELSSAAYGDQMRAAVDINEFMNSVFGYYVKLRYSDGRPHVKILSGTNIVTLSSSSCVQLLSLFHFSMKASFNEFTEILAAPSGPYFVIRFKFRASKRTLSRMFGEDGTTSDRLIYEVMGFDGSDLIYAKRLARESGGQVDIKFDGTSVTATLSVPISPVPPVRSSAFVAAFTEASKDLARILLRIG